MSTEPKKFASTASRTTVSERERLNRASARCELSRYRLFNPLHTNYRRTKFSVTNLVSGAEIRGGGLCELAIGRSMVVVPNDGATESNIAWKPIPRSWRR